MGSIDIFPASIFEKSRMSLMIVSNESPEIRTASAYSRCSDVSWVSRRSPVIPSTPFMGVRISWLIAATKSPFALVAASARSLASARACSRSRWTVMSSTTPIYPRIVEPFGTTAAFTLAQTTEPSGFTNR